MMQARSHLSRRERHGLPRRAVGVFLAVAVVATVAGGCSRWHTLNRHLDAIEDDDARRIVRDAIWAHGSKYRWANCEVLRAEVTRTEHRPCGDADTREVWLLDPVGGRFRIETPARREVTVFDGSRLRIFRNGVETTDVAARGRAAGDARLVTELLPMPLSLARQGRRITYAGMRTGPGEARTWQRLTVTYGPGSGYSGDDRTEVEIRKGTDRVETVVIRWSEDPFFGRPMRVRMDDWRPADWQPANWRPADRLVVSRRWRLTPIDEAGAPTGPVLYTVRIRRVEVNTKASRQPFLPP